MDHHDRDRDRRRGQDRPLGGDTFRPREQGVARGDGFRSGHGRSPPTSNDTYKPFNERGTRPRSRSPGVFRRRSRSPPQMRSRGGIIPADTWRAGQDPEPTGPAGRRSPRRWSPRRDDHVSGRSRSPTRGPRMRSRSPLGADLRSPRDGRDRYSAAHKRSRELSYDRGFVRGARSPLSASREWRASPGSRRSPPTGPRSASQWRQRSRSPYRSDHRPPRSRPRSPVSPPRAPRVDHQKTSESSSINTSRRSSPPMHPSRAAVMHSDAPTGPSHGRPALRSPHHVPSTGTSGAPNRRSSPRRERTPIPTSRARQYSPQPDVIPRGPAAGGYRRDTNVHTSRDQPMNDVPQASHSYHSNESSNSRNQEISSRDRTNPHLTNVQASSILSAPTQPRGSFRGSSRGSPFPHPGRGGNGGNGSQPHLRSRPHSPSPLSDSVAIQKSTPITPTTSTGPPMVPTGPRASLTTSLSTPTPSHSTAFPPPRRPTPQPHRPSFHSMNSSSSGTYPLTQRFNHSHNHNPNHRPHPSHHPAIQHLPQIVPGGRHPPATAAEKKLSERLAKLQQEKERLERELEERQRKKRDGLRTWNVRERESRTEGVRGAVVERSVRVLDEGDGGAAF